MADCWVLKCDNKATTEIVGQNSGGRPSVCETHAKQFTETDHWELSEKAGKEA